MLDVIVLDLEVLLTVSREHPSKEGKTTLQDLGLPSAVSEATMKSFT